MKRDEEGLYKVIRMVPKTRVFFFFTLKDSQMTSKDFPEVEIHQKQLIVFFHHQKSQLFCSVLKMSRNSSFTDKEI